MKPTARLVQGALLAASLGPLTLAAQSFPSRQITIVVPASPGGAIDLAARLIGQKLTDAWGQPVVIENKAGGGSAQQFTAFIQSEIVKWGTVAKNAVIQPE